MTPGLEAAEVEVIGEEGFGENSRLISVKQAQFKLKQVGSYERQQEIHGELLRLHRELGRDCVDGQVGDRWTSVPTRDNFP